MSETITPEPPVYPGLSEATENDTGERQLPGGLTEEQVPATPPQEAPPAEAPPDEPAEEDDDKTRTARLARELREQKRRARQLEQEAQVLRGQRTEQPNEQMEREIQQRAAMLAQQQAINEKSNVIYNEGIRAYGRAEFDDAVKHMNETFGQLTPVVIDTLTDIDDAPKLIQHLADNPDVADKLAGLPPHKLGAALAKEAAKLTKPKQVSQAPAPIRPLNTTSSAEPETDIEKMSMAELDRLWTQRDNRKRFGML